MRRHLDDAEDQMEEYFSGRRLYGDDFAQPLLEAWFADEKGAYAALPGRPQPGGYPYTLENVWLLFRHLPDRRYTRVLSYGGAFGEELLPILDRTKEVVIVESSEALRSRRLGEVPVRHLEPVASGALPLDTGSVELVTCFSALHHVANVSTVLREFARCLKPGGYALVKEPTVSMGDWRKERPNLTPHERGIPIDLFKGMVDSAGFEALRIQRFNCPLSRLATFLERRPWNQSAIGLRLDAFLSRLTSVNCTYHARTTPQKIRPVSVAMLLKKPEAP